MSNTIQICVHCQEKTTNEHCRNCSTKEKRNAMDDENRVILKDKNWHSSCQK